MSSILQVSSDLDFWFVFSCFYFVSLVSPEFLPSSPVPPVSLSLCPVSRWVTCLFSSVQGLFPLFHVLWLFPVCFLLYFTSFSILPVCPGAPLVPHLVNFLFKFFCFLLLPPLVPLVWVLPPHVASHLVRLQRITALRPALLCCVCAQHRPNYHSAFLDSSPDLPPKIVFRRTDLCVSVRCQCYCFHAKAGVRSQGTGHFSPSDNKISFSSQRSRDEKRSNFIKALKP